MSDACGIHEEFMNEYGLILSRVGGGVRVRGGLGVGVSIQDQSFGLQVVGALRAFGFGATA